MIEFKNITKKYKDTTVVSDISFTIERGNIVVLVGSSGSGKTTILKMINRLIAPTVGEIFINGENILDKDVIKLRRNIGYVIQQTGLLPHLTVKQNIEVIPKLQKLPKDSIHKKTYELMNMVGLEPSEFLDRYPHQLSGGQKQRVGVARAFACNPDVILMDEPFSALDPITRMQLQDELVEINNEFKKTIVFVTHDMEEAIKIADKICLINKGTIAQYDFIENILKNPANEYVEEFIGKNRIWSSPELIRAKDIMIIDPICTKISISVTRAIKKMRKEKVDTLIVTDKENKLLGIVYAKDLQSIDDKSQSIESFIRKNVKTVSEDLSIVEILEMINGSGRSLIPVVDECNTLKGLITKTSLLTTLSYQYTENTEDQNEII